MTKPIIPLTPADDLDRRLTRMEASEDCGFVDARDPFAILSAMQGPRFAEYRRQWQAASDFSLETPYPLQLDFELNYSCNLRCPMCTWSIEATSGTGRKDWFPIERFKQIVSDGVSRGLRALDMSYVNEPLIRRDLPEFVRFARDAGVLDIAFNTNGTLLTPAFSRELIDSGLTRLQFSLDAFSAESFDKVRTGGDYDKVVANVLHFLELKASLGRPLPLVGVSFVKQRDNQHELADFVAFWESRVDYVLVREYLTPVLPTDEHYDEKSAMFAESRHLAGEFRCTKPWQRMIVRWDGTLLPCCTFHGAHLPVGNVLATPIEQVWTSPAMRELRELHRRGEFYKNPVCKACAFSSTASAAAWDR